MSDPFPTPRGALSPDGVTAAVQQTTRLHAVPVEDHDPDGCPNCAFLDGILVEARTRPLGVPGYAGAKGAVPEPQGPTTLREVLRDIRRQIVSRHPGYAGDHYVWTVQFNQASIDRIDRALTIETEARAAAPADIDAERLARCISTVQGGQPRVWAERIAAEYRRLASPDATRDLSRTPEDMDR